MQRNYTWKTTDHLPTGSLALRAYAALGVKWQQEWVERKAGELPHRFRTNRRTLVQAVPAIEQALERARLEAEERHRDWEIEKAKRDREEQERREQQAYKESREQLLAIVDRWALACRIEDFFADTVNRSEQLQPGERTILDARLAAARETLGSVNTLKRFSGWMSSRDRCARAIVCQGGD
jgi:hypothetical protein